MINFIKKMTSAIDSIVNEKKICKSCSDLCSKNYFVKDPGNKNREICKQCVSLLYIKCPECDELKRKNNSVRIMVPAEGADESWTYVYQNVCEDCYHKSIDDYFECDRCSRIMKNQFKGDEEETCVVCAWERIQNCDYNRDFNSSGDYVEAGKRAYATEIECYHKDPKSYALAMKQIDKGVGIMGDGSLGNGGHEFVTPRLSGEKGEKVLKDLCTALKSNKFYVDRTCGLHIHIDTSDYMGNTVLVKRLMLFYMVFEPVIFSYLPMSRRQNRYCLPLTEFYHEKEITNCPDFQNLEAVWYRENSAERRSNRKQYKGDTTRYAGVNFHSLFYNKNLEIRYHSGTVDYIKIRNWIDLHVLIITKIARGEISYEMIAKVKFIVDMKEKQDFFFKVLDIPSDLKKYYLERQAKFGITTAENQAIESE